MKPQTKETAILMLVDSIEAASRTIFPPEQKKFEEMIQRVVFLKLNTGQLDESGLSLEDLRIITSRLATTLVNAYHGRIKYPWQREAEAKQAAENAAEIAAELTRANGSAAPALATDHEAEAAEPNVEPKSVAEAEPAEALPTEIPKG